MCWSTKAEISETRKDRRKSYYGGPIGTHQRSFERYHPDPLRPRLPQDLGFAIPTPKSKSPIAIISGTGKATNIKFGLTFTRFIWNAEKIEKMQPGDHRKAYWTLRTQDTSVLVPKCHGSEVSGYHRKAGGCSGICLGDYVRRTKSASGNMS